MNNDKIKNILMKTLILDKIYVTNNNDYYNIIVISKLFTGISTIKKQQIIYAPLMKYILNKQIHALSIQAYSPEEWEKKK
ncbi:Uncharacterized protein YrbA [Serratia symbiotica]|nr:Uncharacterized protein YrbA [Serratia symbiotica]